MALKIYINNQLQRAEIVPSNTPTLDETLETFSFALISNDQPLPLAPMQEVKVDFKGDGTDVVIFYLVSDSVDTYSLNPIRYKHTISCIQNTRKLSKHLVRNSVFSQPANPIKSSFNSQSGYDRGYNSGQPIEWGDGGRPSANWGSEPLALTSKEKIATAKLKISFQYVIAGDGSDRVYYGDAKTISDILATADMIDSLSVTNNLTLRYKDSSNVTQTETITPSTLGISSFGLNQEYTFTRIEELSKNGCYNFEILFPDLYFISGTWKSSGIATTTYIEFYMVQIQIIAETYYNSAYDILDLLVKRQQHETTLNSQAALFTLPTNTNGVNPKEDELYNLLKNTIAPNFAFTQLTMYECAAEVFRLFDAIFTMDENGKLGIEYFNDLSGEEINPKITGRNLSQSEDKYTNGLVSYYQDARQIITFPNNKKFAHLRSSDFGVPNAEDHHFIVPFDISSIIKCEVIMDEIDTTGQPIQPNSNSDGIVIDITRFVVNQDVWSTLDTGPIIASDYETRTIKQINTIYYKENDNKLEVAYTAKDSWGVTNQFALYNAVDFALTLMCGIPDTDLAASDDLRNTWNKIKMRLTYKASIDGVTKVHSLETKYNGETLVDQANGSVDLNKLGLNMLGLSMKLGNPTLNATHRITSWDNRIKTGQLYNYEGKLWVANVVNYTFFNGYLQGKISFVQNFNALSLRTQLLREKRMTNISRDLIAKSEAILTDFIYYSTSPINATNEIIHFNSDYLLNYVFYSFVNSVADRDGINYSVIYEHSAEPSGTDAIFIPMVKYGSGNAINFEMSFESPISAGLQTDAVSQGWWTSSVNYYTQSINYTDEEGFKETINIKTPIYNSDFTTKFPLVNIPSDQYPPDILNAVGYFNIDGFKVYKQPNEIFALNYQLAFLPFRENVDFLGSQFINDNAFIDLTPKERKLFICFKEEKSSFLDTKANPYFLKKEIVNANINTSNNNIYFNFSGLSDSEKARVVSWCLVDSKDNILFASNSKLTISYEVSIYFISRLNRV